MAKRVYFAFHYQDVLDFRANVVRKHNFFGGADATGYYDHSIWEDAKKTSPIALKRLINAELQNSSVTAILIGSETWARRWVRYEIMKSIERGNKVIGVNINSIKGKDQFTKANGPNPFDYLGLGISASGTRATPTEWVDGKWVYYSDLDPFDVDARPQRERGEWLRLSNWLPVYDWIADDGYKNFSNWI